MIKRLVMKLIGKNLAQKLNLRDEPETAPVPGQAVVSVPWYQSKAKIGFLIYIVAIALKFGPPAFGKPPIEIPKEALDLLEGLGLGVGGYGLRDAIKKAA